MTSKKSYLTCMAIFKAWVVSAVCIVLMPGTSHAASMLDGNTLNQADKLLIVDCLLPGQVRRLGAFSSFLTPRRPVKTSASDCEIRGGEYVAYDRASYSSALKIWLPKAQDGDPAAQTYVGEIFEKGLGTAPDYAAAASWYKKAADQGHLRALINLGFLHEQGLGVKKDPAAALTFYRKAAGLEGIIALDAPPSPSSAEIKMLREELEQTRRELDKAGRALDMQRLKSNSEVEQLLQRKLQAAAAGNFEETRRLEAQLKQRESELEAQRQQVARLEKSVDEYRTRLGQSMDETATLKQDLQHARKQLSKGRSEVDAMRAQAGEAQRRLDELRQELGMQKQSATAESARIAKSLAADLHQRQAELARKQLEIVALESKVKTYQDKVVQMESTQPRPVPVVAYAGPSIQIMDPPVVLTRDVASVKVRGLVEGREIVGRVNAPAGLLSFTINDMPQEVDENGLFKKRVGLSGSVTRVTLLAVDKQGKRALTEFKLEKDLLGGNTSLAAITRPDFNFGGYYALVIGNQKYAKLPPLETPEADADGVARILTEKYGFNVTKLINVTRYEMLSELNKLRSKLTEKDNLLIYYAGHGELDRANLRGYWLPIDAEPDSDANWISSVSITDILNAMSVKHAIVIADSCYSGAMTRGSIGQLESGMSDEARLTWLKAIASAKSRTALTSGGLKPVLDGGGGKHSVFARNLINILDENRDILETQRLYREISARVLNIALKQRFEQRPEYAPLRFAGHESGDFLFVPAN